LEHIFLKQPLAKRNKILSLYAQPAQADWLDGWWMPRHKQKIVDSKRHQFDVVIFGDSIIHQFETVGINEWKALINYEEILNLGFSGDRTENVLWRIQHGELEHVSPSKIIILIGTNNTGHRFDDAQDTFLGIQSIIFEINNLLPHSEVILLGLLPRSKKPEHKFRIRNLEINELLAHWSSSQEEIQYYDIGELFAEIGAEVSNEIMPDALHLSERGYAILVNALNSILEGKK